MTQQKPSIVDKTEDLILWYYPYLSRLPKDHKFVLGENIASQLYKMLESFNEATFMKFAKEKIAILEPMNAKLELLRIQSGLMLKLEALTTNEKNHVIELINDIGRDLGGWLKFLRKQEG